MISTATATVTPTQSPPPRKIRRGRKASLQRDREWTSLVGLNIALIREDADLTQEQLAEKSGVSASTIAKCELGMHQPSGHRLHLLARALGVSMDVFYEGVEP